MKLKKKKKIESKFDPIAVNISPNIITIISILVMLVAIYFLTQYRPLEAALLIFISGFLDVYDGLVAKKFKRASNFGAFFDRTADRANDGLIIIGLSFTYINVYIGIIILFLMILASYMSSVMETFSKSRIGEEISMRPFRLGLIIFGLALTPFYSLAIAYAIMIFLFLVIFEVIYRAMKAWDVLR